MSAGEQRIADLAVLRSHYLRTGQTDRAALCDWIIADTYASMDEFDRAERYFAEAAPAVADYDRPGVQWNRAMRLLDHAAEESERRSELIALALDVAVASYIATDYERFQVTDPELRRLWEKRADHRLALVMTMAFDLKRPELVAELIESGINAGIHSTEVTPSSNRHEMAEPGTGTVSSATYVDDGAVATTLAAAARLLDDSHLVVDPPPALWYRTSAGTTGRNRRFILGEQRTMAARLDHGLQEIFDAVPEVEAW